MATHHGNEGSVSIGANAVAEVTKWSLSVNATIANDTVIGDTWETNVNIGTNKWSGNLECFWDETNTNGQGAMTAGASVTLNLYPEGSTTGDTYHTGSAIIESIEYSVAREDIITAKFSFIGNGALTTTTVA